MPEGIRAMPVIAVRDPAATARLLGRALGFETAGFWRDGEGRESFGVIRLGRVTLGLRRAEEVAPATGWSACIFLDDAAAAAELCRAAGLAVSGPVERPYGCIEAEVTDPDGNILCLSQDLRPGPDGPGL